MFECLTLYTFDPNMRNVIKILVAVCTVFLTGVLQQSSARAESYSDLTLAIDNRDSISQFIADQDHALLTRPFSTAFLKKGEKLEVTENEDTEEEYESGNDNHDDNPHFLGTIHGYLLPEILVLADDNTEDKIISNYAYTVPASSKRYVLFQVFRI